MESQLHLRDYDDPNYTAEERGEETRSALRKVKEKVDKLKATIKHGHGGEHQDEAHAVNESPVVRSGLAEPTVMGTPVLAEDLYTTHSDIVDPPVRSFAQWEDEERHGAPPPLSTTYETHLTDLPHGGHHTYGGEVNRDELFKGSIGKHTFLEDEEEEEGPPPLSTGYESLADPLRVGTYGYGQDANREHFEGVAPPPSTGIYGTHLMDFAQVGDRGDDDLDRRGGMGTNKSYHMEEDTSVPNPTTGVSPTDPDTGGKEVGITEVLHSFDKMKIFNEHDTKPFESDKHEPHEPKVYTGSHDQFAPEPVENPPLDTIAANPSHPNSSYTQRISSATSAIAEKAAAVKDTIISKLSPSSENKSDEGTTPHKANTKTMLPTATALSHKVADTLSSTLGPVYEKVAEAGSSVASKMQGSGHDDTTGIWEAKTEGKGVKDYLVDTFKPGDDDKVLSEVITNALHLGKGNQQPREGSTTTYEVEVPREGSTTTYEVDVMRDGERRLQESGN